jgi:hypothetical protein
VTRIKLSAKAIADAVTDQKQFGDWGPTSKTALMLALTKITFGEERKSLIAAVESETLNSNQKLRAEIARISAMPLEGVGGGFSGADHNQVLYGKP